MNQEPDRSAAGAATPRPAGSALFAAHDLWASGASDAERVALAARSCGISPDAFESIRAFHLRLVSRPGGQPLVLCRGVSCRMHGADAFHVELKARLANARVLGETLDVHCLSQCEHGPNLKLGDAVLCTGKNVVVTDHRPWRPLNAGPRPVDSPA